MGLAVRGAGHLGASGLIGIVSLEYPGIPADVVLGLRLFRVSVTGPDNTVASLT